MRELDFFVLDVFTERRYAGNQLAVFLVDDVNSDLPMQDIAREINFSETTFVCPRKGSNDGYDVRIFTPGSEVPFAGHPSIGTAFVVRMLQDKASKPDCIVLNEKVGPIPVTVVRGKDGSNVYWMKQNEPEFGAEVPRDQVARVLGLPEQSIDSRFPIQQVSTGLPHMIVPLTSLEALSSIKVSRDAYWETINKTWAKNILVFCPEPHEACNDISVRMFADYLGIPEDPATGSGNGCLGAYLARHKYFGSSRVDLRTEQGYEMGRPSLLFINAEDSGEGISVRVGGSAVVVAKGRWMV